jgi:hypothetical protein
MLTAERTPPTPQAVGRPKINHEQTPARFPLGTLARVDAALAKGEARSDFIREAVERELERRERAKPRGQAHPQSNP